MKYKRLLAASLLSVYLFTSSPLTLTALADDDEMNPVMKLTLDFATASAEKKDATEGAKEALKKQYDDWTWNYVVGSYEKLIFQNQEAEIPAFKEKLKKTVEVLEKLDALVIQLGEGKYDEAAFNAVDTVIGAVDHPAANAIWAAVKLAYESHQAVKSTGAELQIEALYGALDNDRRLRGSSSGDGPKLFNMDSQTVDYFFNKYLISNSGTREMMKAYVRVKLGEEFPEADTVTKFSDWIFGTEAAKEAELAELEKFKNVSRRWTMALLKDLNEQARVNYNETRARQELAAFQKFAEKFKYLNLSADEILKEYKDIQKYKEDSKNFPTYLSDSAKKRAEIEQQYTKVSKSSYKGLNALIESASPVVSKVYNGKIKAGIIGMKDFEASFSKEIELWNVLTKKISADMSNITAQEAKQEVLNPAQGYGATNQVQSFYNSYFGTLITEYQWKNDFEAKNKEVIDKLNSGEFKEAGEIPAKVEQEEYEGLGLHYSDISKSAETIYKNAYKGFSDRYNSIAAQINRQGHGSSGEYNELYANQKAMSDITTAYKMFKDSISNINNSQYHKLDESLGLMRAAIYEYNELAKELAKELETYRTALKGIYPNLPIRTAWLDGKPLYELRHENSLEFQHIEEAYKSFNENRYTFFPKSNSTSPRSYPGELYNNALQIEAMASSQVETAEFIINAVPTLIKKWESALKDWKALKKPDNDTINQIVVLVDKNFNYKNEFGIAEEGAARVAPLTSELKSMLSKVETESETEFRNRTTDVEFVRLKLRQYSDYLDKLMKEKIIEYDTQPSGVWISKGRNFTGEYRLALNADPATGMVVINTPYPHLATQKEVKTAPELSRVKSEFKSQPFYAFVQGNAPQITAFFDKLFSGEFTPYAHEENLLFGAAKPENIVWISDLTNAEKLVSNITVEDPAAYYKSMKALADAIPKVVRIASAKDLKEQVENEKDPIKKHYLAVQKPDELGIMLPIDETNLASSPMGKRFLDLRAKTAALIEKRRAYIQKKNQDASDAYYRQEKINYFKQEIQKISNKVKPPPANYDEDYVNTVNTELFTLKGRYSDNKLNDTTLDSLFASIETDIINLTEKLKQQGSQDLQSVKDLYSSFKQAYESQNASLVMSKISNSWECSEGTTTSDLENNFRNMFSVFNAISYNISNMNITKNMDGSYRVSYDVEIIGQIYDSGITHKEKSSVSEIVKLEGKSFKISKTLNGRFWYVE